MSSPSQSIKKGEVVDEFRQHDGVVTVATKLFPQGFAKHNGFRTEDQLEGEGAPAHGLVNRGVPQGLSLSSNYMLSPGPFLGERASPKLVWNARKGPSQFPVPNATVLGVWPRGHGPRRLAQGWTPGSLASGP